MIVGGDDDVDSGNLTGHCGAPDSLAPLAVIQAADTDDMRRNRP